MIYCEHSNKYFKSTETMNKYRRMQAHAEFDPIRQYKIANKVLGRKSARNDQYIALADYLGVPEPQAHMAVMDKATCLRVIDYARTRKKKYLSSD